MAVSTTEPTREKLFNTLRTKGQSTVSELADSLRITPVAVRHHLATLQAEGMVDVREEKHGVGRPRQVYKLSPSAMGRDPTKYYQFTNLLLKQLKENLSPDTVNKLLIEVASSIASEWKKQLDDLPMPERIHRLGNLLSEEGFVARVEEAGPGRYILTELSCPFARISLAHPEICFLDETILSQVLDTPIERTSCIRAGSDSCTYLITHIEEDTPDE
jgi:DeoR family suf operon transcriptional repressor